MAERVVKMNRKKELWAETMVNKKIPTRRKRKTQLKKRKKILIMKKLKKILIKFKPP